MLLGSGYTHPYDDILSGSHIFPSCSQGSIDFEFVDDGVRRQEDPESWLLKGDTFEICVPDPDATKEMFNHVLEVLGHDKRIPKIAFVKGVQAKWHLGIHAADKNGVIDFVEAMSMRPLLGIAFAEAYSQAIKDRSNKRWRRKGCCRTMVESHGVRIELSFGPVRPHPKNTYIDTRHPVANTYWIK